MSKFTDTVQQDTPRLVVMYRRENDSDLFQWGIVGAIPIIPLVGYIVRTQVELHSFSSEDCPLSAFVITWDPEYRLFNWFVHPSIPIDPLVGMLEMVKITLVGTHIARQAANQQVILGPDGQPARG